MKLLTRTVNGNTLRALALQQLPKEPSYPRLETVLHTALHKLRIFKKYHNMGAEYNHEKFKTFLRKRKAKDSRLSEAEIFLVGLIDIFNNRQGKQKNFRSMHRSRKQKK